MSKTELVQTSTLKVGNFLVIDGKPCRILSYTTAKPGKHGSSKTLFDTKDILSGKNVQFSAPSKGTVMVPEVVRETYSVIDVNFDGFMVLMKNGVLREDVRLPEGDLGEEIKGILIKDATAEVTIMSVMDHTIIDIE